MTLGDLMPDETRLDPRFASVAVTGVTADSRKVKPGFLFVAVPGTKADGGQFAKQAVASGAVAVASEQSIEGLSAAFVQVKKARRALSLAAAKFYPRQPKIVAAVTGTSGKTSVAAFTRQIWDSLGEQAASVG